MENEVKEHESENLLTLPSTNLQ